MFFQDTKISKAKRCQWEVTEGMSLGTRGIAAPVEAEDTKGRIYEQRELDDKVKKRSSLSMEIAAVHQSETSGSEMGYQWEPDNTDLTRRQRLHP